MKRAFIFLTMSYMLALQTPARAGDILDRIIVVVNNTPVLLSDWDEAWRCDALLAGRTPESYSPKEQHDIYNRLVDQELLRQQMRGYLLSEVSDSDVQARVKDVRAQLGGSEDSQWQTILSRAGVTEHQLRYHLRQQMELERFIDVRFRASIRIEDYSVNRYYYNEFLPQLRQAGAKDVPLDQVAGKIREILVQQQIAEQLSSWIQSLREQAEIRMPEDVPGNSNVVKLGPGK